MKLKASAASIIEQVNQLSDYKQMAPYINKTKA